MISAATAARVFLAIGLGLIALPNSSRADVVQEPVPTGEYVYAEELPKIIERVPCPAPADASRSGYVIVQALVRKDGRVGDCKVTKSVPGLDETALACVRQYRFEPAMSNGKAVAVWVAIPVEFGASLETRASEGESPWRLVSSLGATRVVRLRSGERTRPFLGVECNGMHTRVFLDLMAHRFADSGLAPLTGRLVLSSARGNNTTRPEADNIVWPMGYRRGRYLVPDSSMWVRSLSGVSRVRIDPDSWSPLAEPVEFNLAVVGPWREGIDNCARAGAPPESLPNDTGMVRWDMPELPEVISKVPPAYPQAARDQRIEGMVILDVLIDTEGRVAQAQVQRSIPGLDEAAIACVRQWRFRPAQSGDEPVAVWIKIPIRFSLH